MVNQVHLLGFSKGWKESTVYISSAGSYEGNFIQAENLLLKGKI